MAFAYRCGMKYKNSTLHRKYCPRPADGFTLIEMVVVLIVIALLMMGQAKGSQLLDVAREKKLESDFRKLATAIYTYQYQYRAIPGDDALADQHTAADPGTVGNGNGRLEGTWTDAASASEASRIWLHLRLANLLEGVTDISASDYFPVNAFGHPLGIQSRDGAAVAPIQNASGIGVNGIYIACSRGIPGRLVQSLDIKMDDGSPSTGAMMATPDTGDLYALGAPAATDVDPDRNYIVCFGL